MEKLYKKLKYLFRDIYYYFLLRNSSLFNSYYYLENNPDVRKADIDPLWHFIRWGWKEGRNPSDSFNTKYYLRTNPDVRNARINPLIHYINFVEQEHRLTNPKDVINEYNQFLNSINRVTNGYIFIIHDASLTGAPISFLNLCKAYTNYYGENLIIISLRGGPLIKEYKKIGNTLVLNNYGSDNGENEELEDLFLSFYKLGYRNCIANTIISGTLCKVFNKVGFYVIYLIHELPNTIETLNCVEVAKEISKSSSVVVFAANYVAEKFCEHYGLPKEQVQIIPQGLRSSMIYDGSKSYARSKLINKLNIVDNSNVYIVLGVGLAQYRKGTDLFLDVIHHIYEIGAIENVHFVWLGNRTKEFEQIMKNKIPRLPYASHIHFIDFEKNPAYIFAASDLYLLTSREDPFPSTALEALANQIPVIMFKDTGGIEEILNGDNGVAVNKFDTKKMAEVVLDWLRYNKRGNFSNCNLSTYQDYITKIISLIESKKRQFIENHQVSVIIPNYNYETYLEERISSIINQNYPISEIIFLDDASNDRSVKIARDILENVNIPYKIIENTRNQGVFKQWLKGINEAKYDYIWIAEADDVASPDFLEIVMKGFKDSDVVISYCQPTQIDENSNEFKHYNYLNYVKDFSETKWNEKYCENGQYEVQNYLSIKNTIPNASGVIIKKSALSGIVEYLSYFNYAGDWFLYIYALQKGKISYSPQILNFFRRHNQSVIASGGGNETFFKEIQFIYNFIVDNFIINNQIINKMENNIGSEKGSDRFNNLITDFFRMLQNKNKDKLKNIEKLNILIILSEFKIGGGEITGLRLANHLAKKHNVYLFNARGNYSENFLKMIDKDVSILQNEQSVRQLIHSGKLNFVNSHVWWGDKFAYRILKDNSIFWILSMHGCYEMLMNNSSVDPFFNTYAMNMINRANAITFDSEKNLEYIYSLHNNELMNKTIQIENGFTPQNSREKITRQELGFTEDTFLFVFVARGIREKGWEQVLSSAKTLKQEGFDVGFILIGNSTYVEKLKKENIKNKYIKFVGEQYDIAKYLKISDCGLLPTYFVSESQPLTVIEYLASELPVIATDIGEIRSMLSFGDKKAGLTISLVNGYPDKEELLSHMKKLLMDKEFFERLKSSTKIIFSNKFSIEKFSNSYLSLYYNN